MAKAHTLIDTFGDNYADPAVWSVGGTPAPTRERVRETNGRVEITPRGGPGDSYGGYQSVDTYDLTESQVYIEVVRTLNAAPYTETLFSVELDTVNEAYFAVSNGFLVCQAQVAGAYLAYTSVPYDPVAHRWLQLRERGGTLFYDVSPDAKTWTTLAAIPAPFSLDAVSVKFEAGHWDDSDWPGTAVFDNLNVPESGRSRRVEERRLSAGEVREQAAEVALARRHDEHANNNDEVNYPAYGYIGNFSKGLRHDAVGDPEPVSYGSLLRALESRDPADFEEIILGPGGKKLTNPQAGLTFDPEGPDAQEVTQPPAPRFDSETTAHEMGELYWMAAARDVPFAQWAAQSTTAGSIINRAITSLNNEFPAYGGPRAVTVQNLFRGVFPGEQVGPYVSQLLWKGNADPRKPVGQGRNATDGFVAYGSQTIDQRQWTVQPNVDFLTSFSDWLAVQNGRDDRGGDQFDFTQKRFIRSLRDGANYVHFDLVINAWYNAAWYLLSEPMSNGLAPNAGAVPMRDREFPLDQGNPYDPPGTATDSRTQAGFCTFGDPQVIEVLTEVIGQACRAVWWQKWGVHRRLRPEEYGGRVDNHIQGRRTYTVTEGGAARTLVHSSLLASLQSGGLSPYFGQAGEKFPAGYLLPQAYPEGAPTHPAYGAGHATLSGACATVLKAFFDEGKQIEYPVQASADGLSLSQYTGADAAQITVGGEINKLAGNIALFRNAAGVHWRSDYTESLLLGEQVAIRLLQELSLGFQEDDAFFELTRFDGIRIRIFDGCVREVEQAY